VHRIGRTARAGASGHAISFACEDHAFSLMDIEEYIGHSLTRQEISGGTLEAPNTRSDLRKSSGPKERKDVKAKKDEPRRQDRSTQDRSTKAQAESAPEKPVDHQPAPDSADKSTARSTAPRPAALRPPKATPAAPSAPPPRQRLRPKVDIPAVG